ncbi:MAG: RsmB/NOP family class I SAM-dependent RNA methyltransferase [Hyphomicrobiaceae bacterium]
MNERRRHPSRSGQPGRPAGQQSRPGKRQTPPLPGLAARKLAAAAVSDVLDRHHSFDAAFQARAEALGQEALAERDRGFARLIAATVLRRHGVLAELLATYITKPLPRSRGMLDAILLTAAAQLLLLDTQPHAAISLAVTLAKSDPQARRFEGLTNAVLRRLATEGPARLAACELDWASLPGWLRARWRETYGDELARAIAAASLREAPLDLSVKADAAQWAERLGGIVLSTGTVRLAARGRIDQIDGYTEGAWWVQDAAAALPARLLGAVEGRSVLDLCAAPGGKTAQLAAAGAIVTAVDSDSGRLARVAANLTRLGLEAATVTADARTFTPGASEALYDAVLVDAPCTATGTIRRHPDIPHLKRASDIAKLATLQAEILANAARLVRQGGRLVYCTCSLEPEECEAQIAGFLAQHSNFRPVPVDGARFGIPAECLTPVGHLRTLPCHFALDPPELSGIDGFFAAIVERVG